MPETYLHRCCELFGQTVETLHGWRPDYAGLEKALEPVRLRKREFSYRDIETIQNGRYWDFRQFWRFPGESDLEREVDFAEMSRLIQRLPLDEAQAIGRLHAAFKYIENVSVVLRFVNPAQYGILSPPLEKLLEVRRGRNEVETYLSYLRDLRDARDHYGLPRAADADMALWVLQERVLSSYSDHELMRQFRSDTWLLRRRAVNLLAELGGMAGTDDFLDLARALVEANVSLAGALAGFELERRLRARLGAAERGLGLEATLDALSRKAEPAEVEAWRRAARARDLFLDAGVDSRQPTRRDVTEIIDEIERLKEGARRLPPGRSTS